MENSVAKTSGSKSTVPLLLIEDDMQLSGLIREYLGRYGYEVHVPGDFREVVEEFGRLEPALVLLDINLPYYDGYFLCRSIRQQSKVPIIVISARSAEMDQIMALELGADDYMTKPFTFEMLHSKVKAAIRRAHGEYAGHDSSRVAVGDLSVDSNTLAVTYQDKRLELSKNEFKLLKKLMEQHHSYISREVLIEEVWDALTFVDDNTLTVNMTRIRQKLASLGLPDAISSKRGVGYMLRVGGGNG